MDVSLNSSGYISACFNANEIASATRVDIADDAYLRYATDAERHYIESTLTRLSASELFDRSTLPVSGQWVEKPDGTGSTFHEFDAPRRYLVLETQNHTSRRRHEAFLLIAALPLTFGFSFQLPVPNRLMYSRTWVSEHLFQLGNPTQNLKSRQLVQLDSGIGTAYQTLWSATQLWTDDDWRRPLAMIEQYAASKKLSPTGPVKFLALCSVIEGLLAHKPKPTDPTESISRQMKRKIPLLHRRANCPVITANYFSLQANDKALDDPWGALYDLRSQIAHGDVMTFVKGEGRRAIDLGDLQTCIDFVDAIARMLLRQLCIEPQLVSDLRDV